jgi:hypothetical protein
MKWGLSSFFSKMASRNKFFEDKYIAAPRKTSMKNSTLLMVVGILAAVAMISTAVGGIGMQAAEAAKPDKNKGGGTSVTANQINICSAVVTSVTVCSNTITVAPSN